MEKLDRLQAISKERAEIRKEILAEVRRAVKAMSETDPRFYAKIWNRESEWGDPNGVLKVSRGYGHELSDERIVALHKELVK